MMRQSDSASADVEIQKPPKELHLTGAPDCPAEKSSVWSFFLRSNVHSSLIILILLFDRILGLLFALKAEMSSEHRRRRSKAYRWLAVCLCSHRIMFLQRSGQWTLFYKGSHSTSFFCLFSKVDSGLISSLRAHSNGFKSWPKTNLIV